MKLRARLVLAAVGATVPTLVSLAWYDAVSQHRAAVVQLTAYARAHRFAGAEPHDPHDPRDPHGAHGGAPPWHPHGPPPPPGWGPDEGHGPARFPPPDGDPRAPRPARLWRYDASGRALDAEAPAFPSALAATVRDPADDCAVESSWWPSRDVRVLLRLPGADGATWALAVGSTSAAWGAVLPSSGVWLLPVFAVLAAVLLAVGPVIRRVRALAEATRDTSPGTLHRPVALGGSDEVAELARAFDHAASEVRAGLDERERRERALREFLANTTHDVMIPLTVLQGHLSALREGVGDGPASATVTAAMDEAHYLASLVHNLAAVARLDAIEGPPTRAPVDLNALVLRVVARHRPIARQRGVTIEYALPDETVRFDADVTLLEQAVSNVTYNAVRYNRDGGHVAVVLDALGGGRFVLRVLDDGPCIEPAMRAHMFEHGARTEDSRSRAPEGQGLGLHIAVRAAKLHGLALTLDGAEGGGLDVRLTNA